MAGRRPLSDPSPIPVRSGAAHGNPNIRDPVALSAFQAGLNIFTFEASCRLTNTRSIDILKRVDIDDRVRAIVDLAGDEWHRSATRANVKRGGTGFEGVLRHEQGVADRGSQACRRIRCPHAAVLHAE